MHAEALLYQRDVVCDRLAVSRQHEREVHRACPLEGVEIGEECARATFSVPPCCLGIGVQRPCQQRVGGDVADEVVGSQQDAARLIEEHRVGGTVTGPVQDPQRAP